MENMNIMISSSATMFAMSGERGGECVRERQRERKRRDQWWKF